MKPVLPPPPIGAADHGAPPRHRRSPAGLPARQPGRPARHSGAQICQVIGTAPGLRWPERQIDAAELAMRVAGEATGEPVSDWCVASDDD
jgi:hypothetical protein